ncbi:diguanylate cyclase [Paenibacillus sp. TRM 82003]|nr:diguanylate cyclase [Paenibacillus sp. TRM 82003]
MIVALFLLLFAQFNQFSDNLERHHRIENGYNDIFRLLIEQQSGQRGYRLTGNTAFLEPYEQALRQYPAVEAGFLSASRPFPAVHDRSQRLVAQAATWQREHIEPLIAAQRSGEPVNEAKQLAAKAQFDAFRSVADDFELALAEDYRLQRADLIADVRWTMLVSFAAMLVLMLVLNWRSLRRFATLADPLEQLIESVQRFRSGHFREPLPAFAAEELKPLSDNVELLRQNLVSKEALNERIFGIIHALHEPKSPNEVYRYAVEQFADLFGCDLATAMTVDKEGRILRIYRYLQGEVKATRAAIEEQEIGAWPIFKTGEPAYYPNWNKDRPRGRADDHVYAMGIRSTLHLPVMDHGRIVGLINLGSRKTDSLKQEELDIAIRITPLISLALQNASNLAQLEYTANRDGLTGAWNRRRFDETLRQRFEESERTGAPFTLVMLDLDRFKTFNDTYGHVEGDELLKALVRLVEQHLRHADMIARYGGEEFALLLPETARDEAAERVERIRRAIEAGVYPPYAATASFGIAERTADDADPGALLQRADQALYRAKSDGRNQAVIA